MERIYPKSICLIGLIVGWLALILQLYTMLSTRVLPLGLALLKFFSYFTIMTNILVAVCFTVLYLHSGSKWNSWFSKPAVLTATTVYILIVGAVYNLVLRASNHPQGIGILADELLHSVMPLYFLFFWIKYVPKGNLSYQNAKSWLVYPGLYLIYTIIKGLFVHQYPYFFMDVDKIGYPAVMMNSAVLFLIFFGLFYLFIWMDKRMAKKQEVI
ncbi:MAG: Pr6Pr family membrane protein [Sphingobacteriales bacterium]|nr:Pr6Pr family membrane protein [Sphingobacteriales bacterium]